MLTVVVVTRSKSIHCTTLTSLLHLGIYANKIGEQFVVHYIPDKNLVSKYMKHTDRLIFMDYAVSIDFDCIPLMCKEFPKGVQMVVFPAVNEGIDWDAFKKKTLDGTIEPASQRGLTFDTTLGKKLGNFLYEVESTSARVWAMDPKKVKTKMSPEFFQHLKAEGIKICACTKARCIVHYIHKCIANILETSGVTVNK